jgi:dihydroorotase-like cyclic amidohydrolase
MDADLIITNGIVITENGEAKIDLAVRGGKIIALGDIRKPAQAASSDPLYPMINDGDLLDAMEEISRLDSILAIHAENQFIIETYAARWSRKY